MYSRSQLAKLNKVHPNTIIFYEQIGIITDVERKPNGYRVYSTFHKKTN